MMKWKVFLGAAAVCVQAACAVPPTAADDAAAWRRVWRVERFDDANGRPLALAEGRVDLTALPEANAVLGCNTLYFKVNADSSGRLALDEFLSTLKYCEGEMAAEQAFQERYEHIRRYRIRDGVLEWLTEDGRRVMRLRAQ